MERLRERPVLKRLGGFFGQTRSPSIAISVQEVPRTYALTINADRTSVTRGEVISFTGFITWARNGEGGSISGTTMYLYRDNIRVGETISNPDGSYRIRWTADVAGSFTFYTEAPNVG